MSSSSDTRVVITGVGAVTPLGPDAESFRAALYEGRSGVGPISRFDTTAFDPRSGEPQFVSRMAGEVRDFDPARWVKKPRRHSRTAQLGLAAAHMALADAGLRSGTRDVETMGIIVGTGGGDMETAEATIGVLAQRGAGRISPLALLNYIPSTLPASLAIDCGARGPNFGVSSACASATHAIGEAWWMIRRGETERILSGGAEAAITPVTIGGFAAMGVMSRRNDDPASASRPFDRDRDGFVMGEGAGMLVVESLASARMRGARIRAEIAGYGLSGDGHNLSALDPHGSECVRAMRQAMERAGVEPHEIDHVNAHGTSTPQNDPIETAAVKQALGERAREIPISATKSMIGHLLSASGAVETIATVFALEDQRVHPTINLATADPACDLDYVPNRSREATIRFALKNSFGMGGHNACLVLKRWEG